MKAADLNIESRFGDNNLQEIAIISTSNYPYKRQMKQKLLKDAEEPAKRATNAVN